MKSQARHQRAQQHSPASLVVQTGTTAAATEEARDDEAPTSTTTTTIAGNLASPAMYRHLHHSFDRKSHSSSTQRMDTRVGASRGPPGAKHFRQGRSQERCPTPLVAQSTVSTTTTTTTTTTTVTTTTTTNSGNQFNNFQPWYSTVTRTDVQQSSYTQRDSDMVMLAPQASMDTSMASIEAYHPCSLEPVNNLRQGRRRSASERSAAEKRADQPFCAYRPTRRASRRARGISTPSSMSPIDLAQAEIQVQLVKQENVDVAHPWTPAASLQLNSAPKASDLLIIRLLVDESEGMDDSVHFITAIAPKFSLDDQGIVSIPSQPLPPSVLALGITLDQCRLSFSLLSGERVMATHISEYLGGSSADTAPSSKRPRLH